MSLESELRDEYMASDFLSGSAGYRDFFVAKIKEMQAKVEALELGITEHKQCFNADEGDPHDLALWALLTGGEKDGHN